MKYSLICVLVFFLGCTIETTIDSDSKKWTEDDREFLVNELGRSRDTMIGEVVDISEEQWYFRESDDRWSIAEIIEHQELQDQIFYRELTVLTQFPEMIEHLHLANGTDENVLEYRTPTDRNTGPAPWYLTPTGKYCNKQLSTDSYLKLRDNMIDFVRTTDKDLRKYVTPSGRGSAQMRDLHQLMLVTIAHTDRHLMQLQNVKKHTNYPDD